MKTITLKADEKFFDYVSDLAKKLHLTKSELLRKSVKEYDNFIKKQALIEQIKQASLKVRDYNDTLRTEFDASTNDGLTNV